MIEQATFWYMGRSERERWLLAVMAALFALLLFWAALLRPLAAARVTAQQRLDAATSDAGRIAGVAADLRMARAGAPAALAGGLPTLVETAATAAGFTMSRFDVQGPDRIAVAISSAKSPALFSWLSDLERRGIVVDQLTLRTNSDATLAVEGIVRVRGR